MEYLGAGKLFWFVVGFVLFILEILTPGVFFIFFCMRAWAVLLLTAVFPLPTWLQWAAFSVVSVLSLVFLRKHVIKLLARREVGKTDSLSEPMVADRYIGKEVDVILDIFPGKPGAVEFNGTQWQARSDSSLNTGARARIVLVEDLTMVVAPL